MGEHQGDFERRLRELEMSYARHDSEAGVKWLTQSDWNHRTDTRLVSVENQVQTNRVNYAKLAAAMAVVWGALKVRC